MSKYIPKYPRLAALVFFTCGFVLLALSTISASSRGNASRNSSPDAVPPSGTLNPGGATQNWSGTVLGANIVDETTCVEGVSCDTYTLTLSGNPSDWTNKKARVTISWNFAAGDDFDVVVHQGASTDPAGRPNGPIVASAFTSSSTTPEVVDVDPNAAGVGTGVFKVHVIYFLAVPGDTYNGAASSEGALPTPT
ncbi:MAG: hypothetical protein ABI925_10640, partial [Verrucomicrobiota bacterium]